MSQATDAIDVAFGSLERLSHAEARWERTLRTLAERPSGDAESDHAAAIEELRNALAEVEEWWPSEQADGPPDA